MADHTPRPQADAGGTGGQRRQLLRRAAGQEATVLVLMPVAVLVVIILGSIAVDLSMAYAGTRRVADLAAAWANDAASAVDPASHYRDGQPILLDTETAVAWVDQRCQQADRLDPGIQLDCAKTLVATDGAQVTVTVTGDVSLLFLDAFPAIGAPRRVSASSTAALITLD